MKLITGASSGIGKEIASIIKNKDECILVSRRDPLIDGATWLKCALSKTNEVLELIEKIKNIINKLDLIVHSAGIMKSCSSSKLVFNFSLESFMFNTITPLFLTSNLTRELSRAKGVLIALSSIASKLDIPGEVIYSSSKAALDKGIESLSADLSKLGISYIKVHPSLIETPMTEGLDSNQKTYIFSKQAIKNFPTKKELAEFIISLTDQTNLITGSSIYFGGIRR